MPRIRLVQPEADQAPPIDVAVGTTPSGGLLISVNGHPAISLDDGSNGLAVFYRHPLPKDLSGVVAMTSDGHPSVFKREGQRRGEDPEANSGN